MNRNSDAIASNRRAIECDPKCESAYNNLGILLRDDGSLDEAIEVLRKGITLNPNFAEAHNNLGVALKEKGRIQDSISAFQEAIRLRPSYPEARNNLGCAFRDLGKWNEASQMLNEAVALKPDYAEAHSNLGTVLRSQGHMEQALAAFRLATKLNPNHAEAHANLGGILREFGYLEEAIAACRCAARLKPDYLAAFHNLGAALAADGKYDEAIAAYHRALALDDVAATRNNLGNALKDTGNLTGAVDCYRSALALAPDSTTAHSNIILTLHYSPNVKHETIAAECRRWREQHEAPRALLRTPHRNERSPDRRLRVGYVSPDFRDHVVGRNVLPLLRCHDTRKFELLAYSGVGTPDAFTRRFRQIFHRWTEVSAMQDDDMLTLIRKDEVDILVDLSQHTAGNRLAVFAACPAPVQVSFAGYPAGTGLDALKNRISDATLESFPGQTRLNGNERVHHIDTFWCYDPSDTSVEPNPLPALRNGFVTFGCLNSFCKVNPSVLTQWAAILRGMPQSRLILLSPEGAHRGKVINYFNGERIDPNRIDFVASSPRKGYLEQYHRIDLILDTFPYNGHTTSLDALWMGVPVITLVGIQPVSRAGLSQLSHLGLSEFAAQTEREYVAAALALAQDLPRLASLRAALRTRMESSVLMDAKHFARQIEDAYRGMWRAWCATPDIDSAQ